MSIDSSDFQKRLKVALGNMKNGAVKGVKLACAHVKLEAQKRVPVDLGNLKNSATTDVSVSPRGVVGGIGFTAFYATFVHEAPMTLKGLLRKKPHKGKYWDKQGQGTNKFLEKAIDENHNEILTIIKKCAKI